MRTFCIAARQHERGRWAVALSGAALPVFDEAAEAHLHHAPEMHNERESNERESTTPRLTNNNTLANIE
jgi:hypothetical protein